MAALQKSENIEDKLQSRLQTLTNMQKTTTLQSEETKAWVKQQLQLIGAPSQTLDTCIEILEYMGDLKVVWLHLQECTGCSESLLRTETPSFETMIFDLFKVVYHDLVMSPSGHGAVASLEHANAHEKYVLLVEGSIPMGFAKDYITIGNRNGYDEVSHLIHNAEAVFAIGTCSSFGGIQSAYPNPTNGHALSELFDCEIINIPGCPPSDKNIVATLLYYYLFAEAPKLDSLNRPLWAYSKSVHDLCERKSFFMSGDFVESFEDENMKNGYCLYKVGCKGPYTYNNCPKVKFNAKTSWPVQGGHGCIGCSEPNFWDNFGNIEKPLSNSSFFMLNQKFMPKSIPLTMKKITKSIESKEEYMQFASTLDTSTSVFINLKSQNNQILLHTQNNCEQISLTPFSINPKLILQAYESKNKQGKRLYANYQNAFKDRHDSLIKLCDTQSVSTNLNDLYRTFMLIVDDTTAYTQQQLDSINEWLNSNCKEDFLPKTLHNYHILQLAKDFKFPYESELGFKFKREDSNLNIDYAKALSIAMSYRIGGLDSHGLAYSIMCGIAQSMLEVLSDNIEHTLVLQGDIFLLPFIQQIFAKQLQGKKIVVLTH